MDLYGDEPYRIDGGSRVLADRLAAAGVRAELDDRDQPLERALAEADALLVPHVLRVGADGSAELRSRSHETFRACPPDAALAELAAEVRREALPPPDRTAPRLTRHPLGRPTDRRENQRDEQRDDQRDEQRKGKRHGEPA
ncbi:His/Gly/Thr/Pro-type tRNA ligase C-terminal domain-containing protein [Streptomyces triticirhizae]|uniref:His/Gly/Thr/Pro-type tRNA ligase C-terminal domain-containing protein n=1 Tax=Streptomyces triticirhizae TaxID=2483353 RepID=UPI001315799C|nr:His/Gly/Thr/Pro-type tRNA ligase C-terminal domain-containing protein [Streptomyces triticirhizae]